MAQRTQRDLEKEALWRRRLADQAGSGLTIAEWCRRNAVAGSLFHFWKRTIARRGGGSSEAKTGSPVQTKDEVVFAPVVFAAPPVDSARLSAHGVIEIVVAGSRVVRVGADFDVATLARVLAMLEDRSC